MKLLVSVRSSREALSALAGGAGLIDVKEPDHGSLGRAEDHVIRAVLDAVAGRCPVSAALGEWLDEPTVPALDLAFVKWGLAGCARHPRWRQSMAKLLGLSARPQVVLTAYADWQCAEAPPVDEIFALARETPGSVLLIDTHCKDARNPLRKARPTLLDWLPSSWIEDLCARCREAQVRTALAGSLGLAEIEKLLPAQPNWFAVRGAACVEQDRRGEVDAERVQQLVRLIEAGTPVLTSVD